MDELEKMYFNDLVERLKKIESMMFSENILRIKADEQRDNIFKHIAYIYFYGNRTNNFHHWCTELKNFIWIILKSKKKKGGKNPTKQEVINEILNNTIELEKGFSNFIETIIEKEGIIDKNRYKNKQKEITTFIYETIKNILNLSSIDTESIEELLYEYNKE